jgi:class 3 adenylate cyclase
VGAVDYITKPISPPIVLARVHTHLTLKAERERAETLLLNVLPAAIAERLKRNAAIIADAAEEVSVVFADLVGFTPLAASQIAAEHRADARRHLPRLRRLRGRRGVEKIKTDRRRVRRRRGPAHARADHAAAAARFALGLRDSHRAVQRRAGIALQVRIGMDSGPSWRASSASTSSATTSGATP